MRICYLSKEYPPKVNGGVGVYTYEMAHLLSKRGHQVYVLTQQHDDLENCSQDGVNIIKVPPLRLPFFDKIRENLRNFVERLEYSYSVSKKLSELVHQEKIDIVESCEARAEAFWYYLFRNKPPLVIRLHTPEGLIFKWNQSPKNLDYKLINKLEEFWILRARKIVGISEAIIDVTSRYYKYNFNGVSLIPNPINTEIFSPPFKKDSNKRGQFQIVYIGRLEFRKGVHVLVKAIPRILKIIPKTKFIFIGNDCGMEKLLLEKISQFKCEDNVVFLNQVAREELIEYYYQSDICVIPSLWENFPYVCLEAMACATPILASEAGGLPSLIKNKVNGVLFPAGSSRDLADAAIYLLKDEKLRNRLGKAARKDCEEKYSHKAVYKQAIDVYKRILSHQSYRGRRFS